MLSDFFPLLTAINSCYGMQSAWSLQTQWATGHCTWTGVLPSIQSTISHDFIVSLLLHFVKWSVPFAIVLPQFRNARQQTAGFLIFQVNFPYYSTFHSCLHRCFPAINSLPAWFQSQTSLWGRLLLHVRQLYLCRDPFHEAIRHL